MEFLRLVLSSTPYRFMVDFWGCYLLVNPRATFKGLATKGQRLPRWLFSALSRLTLCAVCLLLAFLGYNFGGFTLHGVGR